MKILRKPVTQHVDSLSKSSSSLSSTGHVISFKEHFKEHINVIILKGRLILVKECVDHILGKWKTTSRVTEMKCQFIK